MNWLISLYPDDGGVWQMASVIVQITVVVVLAAIVSRVLARYGGAARYGVWLCALLACLASPLCTWCGREWEVSLWSVPLSYQWLAAAESVDSARFDGNLSQRGPGSSRPLMPRFDNDEPSADVKQPSMMPVIATQRPTGWQTLPSNEFDGTHTDGVAAVGSQLDDSNTSTVASPRSTPPSWRGCTIPFAPLWEGWCCFGCWAWCSLWPAWRTSLGGCIERGAKPFRSNIPPCMKHWHAFAIGRARGGCHRSPCPQASTVPC